MKKVLAVAVGLAVLAFCSWAAAGPGCCPKAKATTASASATCEKVEKASAAACEAKGTSAKAASGEIKAENASTCVEKAVKLSIEGMHSGDCSKKVIATLTSLEGVCASKVSYTRKNAEIVYNAVQLSEETIIQAVNATGYKVMGTKASNWKLSKEDRCKAEAVSAQAGSCKAKKASKASESGT